MGRWRDGGKLLLEPWKEIRKVYIKSCLPERFLLHGVERRVNLSLDK